MHKGKMEDMKHVVKNNPFAILEAITHSEKNYQQLQHIIFRAYIYHKVSSDYCIEYNDVIKPENLVKLQEQAFAVYLNQSRDPLLRYQKTVHYLIMLLNQNVPLKTVLSVSPNAFMDEVIGVMPRQQNKLGENFKNTGQLIRYVEEYHEEDLLEAVLSYPIRVGDILLQGQMFHNIYPTLCKQYDKVTKPQSLEQLLRCAKIRVKNTEGAVTLKKAVDDLCCLLNHNVPYAKVVIMTPREIAERVAQYEKEDQALAFKAFQEIRDLQDVVGEEVIV